MYRAYFKYEVEEPEKMYFTASQELPEQMEFKAVAEEPVKFIINKDGTLEVES